MPSHTGVELAHVLSCWACGQEVCNRMGARMMYSHSWGSRSVGLYVSLRKPKVPTFTRLAKGQSRR